MVEPAHGTSIARRSIGELKLRLGCGTIPRMSAAPVIDSTRCPLCGSDNRCAVEIEHATGVAQPPCWCMATPLDAAAARLLRERIPEQARDAACICTACMARFVACLQT